MSLRPRRALVGLITAVAALALPAAASAAESLSFTLSGTQAGSNPTITTKLTFAGGGDTPSTVVLSLAPGILANGTANPSCTSGAPQLTPACQVGTADVTLSSGPANGNPVYLVAPRNPNEFAGFETVLPAPFPPGYTGASLRTTPTVGVDLTTTFQDTRKLGVTVNGFSLTLNPTLNGVPFTHLPTGCGTATSTTSIKYYGTTTSTNPSGSFTPTGCAALPYAPKLSASITKDAKDSGAAVVLTQSQAIGESSSKSIVFSLPSGLRPNVPAVGPCLTGTGSGCVIGSASATAPGVPNAALANGVVRLSGPVLAPVLSVSFPAPFGLTDTGQVSLTQNTVTFADVPDLPLTSLSLNVTGPNGKKAFNTDCKPAKFSGAFTSQSGKSVSVSSPIAFAGCGPSASATTSGLAKGQPKLKFKVSRSTGAPNLASVAIALPGGLKFSRSAIVSHKTCTTKAPRRCTTTTLISGLGVTGATVKSAAIKSGKLVITFKKATGKATITVVGPLVTETKGLQSKVKKHKTKTLKFSLKITDVNKTATTLVLKPKAH